MVEVDFSYRQKLEKYMSLLISSIAYDPNFFMRVLVTFRTK